jgi:ABC-type bacteriocin/lantibiotic exporter with double-glycine peptidase domain
MIEIINFIKENLKVIIIIVVVLLFLLILINITGINLNEKKTESKLVQKVTVETFNSISNLPIDINYKCFAAIKG